MDIENIFTESRWNILTELSRSSLSPSELARRTGTTIANISTQLRLLEALDFIEREKLSNTAKGEPRKLYSLKKDFSYLILASKAAVGKKLFKIDSELMPFFSVWMINESHAPHLILKFYLEHEAKLANAKVLGYLGARGDELELLIIHPDPGSINELNGRHLTRKDKTYKIKVHMHTAEDFAKGIANKEDYFVSILRKVFIVMDKDNVVTKLKKG
jgi:DNA-binding HxlR family transcriptional regulator